MNGERGVWSKIITLDMIRKAAEGSNRDQLDMTKTDSAIK